MKENNLLFSNCTLFNGKLFFVEVGTGLPALMDPESGDVHYCDIIDNYIYKVGDVVDYIDSYQQKIYILEQSGENLIVLDLENNKCRYMKISCDYCRWENFAAFEKYEANYYIFPKYGEDILTVNVNNGEINKLDERFCSTGEPRFCYRVRDDVWILSEGEETIGAFDLKNRTMKVYELKEKIEEIVDAVQVEGNIYFLNRVGIIYQWNIEQKRMKTIKTLRLKRGEAETVCKIVYAGNKLIVFPSFAEEIKLLDLVADEMDIYQGYPSDFIYQQKNWSKYYGYCEDEYYYYFAMRSGNYLLKLEKKNGNFLWVKPALPNEEKKNELLRMYKDKKGGERLTSIICEENGCLRKWIKQVSTNYYSYNSKETDVGRKIYNEWRAE